MEKKYSAKWVEQNLGITSPTIRNYERKNLIYKIKGAKREYTAEEVDRLLDIKLLNGVGFTLSEIDLYFRGEIDIQEKLEEKVSALAKEIEEKNQLLNYAKKIIATGRILDRARIGEMMPADDFNKYTAVTYGTGEDAEIADFLSMLIKFCSCKEEDYEDLVGHLSEDTIDKVLQLVPIIDKMISPYYVVDGYIKALIDRKHLGANNDEVQVIAKLIYERLNGDLNISKIDFARHYGRNFLLGDIGKFNALQYGEDSCQFIADVFAVFAGFMDVNALNEYEMKKLAFSYNRE